MSYGKWTDPMISADKMKLLKKFLDNPMESETEDDDKETEADTEQD